MCLLQAHIGKQAHVLICGSEHAALFWGLWLPSTDGLQVMMTTRNMNTIASKVAHLVSCLSSQ